MKGLITSWLYCKKTYFIIDAAVFVLACAAITVVVPLLNLEENQYLQPVVSIGALLLGFSVMVICGESLDKDVEDMLKTGFADYVLTGGISRHSFVNVLLVRNLICCGLSLAEGAVILGLYLSFTKTQAAAEIWLIVPLLVLLIHSVDFMITPLVIKFKNAEKAGFVLGLVFGMIIFVFMGSIEITDSETLITMAVDPLTAAIIIAGLILLYIPAYFLTLNRIKRGDIC